MVGKTTAVLNSARNPSSAKLDMATGSSDEVARMFEVRRAEDTSGRTRGEA